MRGDRSAVRVAPKRKMALHVYTRRPAFPCGALKPHGCPRGGAGNGVTVADGATSSCLLASAAPGPTHGIVATVATGSGRGQGG